jgi:hypothetical protein
MEIFAFDNSEKWVPVNDKIKFLVDYLTPDQSYKLQVVLKKGIDFKINYDDDRLPIMSELTEEQKAKFDAAWDLFMKTYLKYVIKNWSGVIDGKGKEIKCVLVDNELEDRLWVILCNQKMLVAFLFSEAFTKVLRWSDTDKKKFISEEDSNMKAD